MEELQTIGEANSAALAWWYGARGAPKSIASKIDLAALLSPVDTVVRTAELIYAHRDDLDAPANLLGARLALFCGRYGFHDMGEGGRGLRMSLAMRRRSGERAAPGHPWPEPKDEPGARA